MTVRKENLTAIARPAAAASAAVRPADHVADALGELCDSLGPGGRIPPQFELMRRFGASERAVREALEALRRSGRIVSRRGSGTFVAEGDGGAALPPPPIANARSVVAVAPTDHSFFERSLDLFCRHAEAADLTPVCRPVASDASPESLAALGATLAATSAGAGGFLIFGFPLEPVARRLHEGGGRVVLFGTPPAGVVAGDVPFPLVFGDQEYGGYLVTAHLIALGHRRIAFVYFDGEERLPGNRRWRGHRRALDEARRRGVAVEDTVLGAEARDWEAEPARAAAVVRSPGGAPTALACWNDHVATALLSALRRAGVDVPGEVSVAGYDDLPEGRTSFPRLTTVDPAAGQMLRVALDLLERDGPPPPGFTVTVPTLVPRESTAAPPPPRAP